MLIYGVSAWINSFQILCLLQKDLNSSNMYSFHQSVTSAQTLFFTWGSIFSLKFKMHQMLHPRLSYWTFGGDWMSQTDMENGKHVYLAFKCQTYWTYSLNTIWKYLKYAWVCSNISLLDGYEAYWTDRTDRHLDAWTILIPSLFFRKQVHLFEKSCFQIPTHIWNCQLKAIAWNL
jgi:hypothetical protein